MENNTEIVAASSANTNDVFELGTWLGRHQAFGWIANKCSAADAVSLREIKQRKQYRSIGLTWEDFLQRYAGVSPKTADQIITRLEEFGESYFNLSQILHITTPEYRALAPSIEDNTLVVEGERIPICREKTLELMRAIESVRVELRVSEQKRATAEQGAREDGLWHRVSGCMDEITGRVARKPTPEQRAFLVDLFTYIYEALGDAERVLGLKRRPPESQQ